jgi:hypothetical protein
MSATMPRRHASPPSQVTLVYREVGKTHVFTAIECRGLHVGSKDLKDAFENAIDALGQHVSLLYKSNVEYEAEITFEEFLDHMKRGSSLAGNIVKAKRAEPAHA